MSDIQRVIERAAELAGGVEALATMLAVPSELIGRWLGGTEEVPADTGRRLSKCIAEAERAASRVKPLLQPGLFPTRH